MREPKAEEKQSRESNREVDIETLLRTLPSWVTPKLIEATIDTWQPYYCDPLTEAEAAYMIMNVSRLCDTFRSKSPNS